MNPAIDKMLSRYQCQSINDYENALKEILQELALLGLWRAKFFEHAAFYGGTALRILYGLDRFSEDLDFSLLHPNSEFTLKKYLRAMESEIESFGFGVTVTQKEKSIDSAIQSAFIKGDTLNQLMSIDLPQALGRKVHARRAFKIKVEIDIDPPMGFKVETKSILQPIPFRILCFKPCDLFAGKVHALLCREWKTRVKGRDWYDFVWYLAQKTPLSLKHLKERLVQTGHWKNTDDLTLPKAQELLLNRLEKVDLDRAKEDVIRFVNHPESLEVWSPDFFGELIRDRLKAAENS
ncbi:MAG: nucleotidyl transferase AbiEii/AbiGii toxin family protein [Myxococcota bacterium]|nr:nucleotidyl transferase AbiEii/AbiGii toxin family protein [Myxococcota bacterium]